jgi:hypothetical protein
VLLYTEKEKEGKPDRKPHPLPYGLRNPYRNLKSDNSQDYAQKPQRNCTFMSLDSGHDDNSVPTLSPLVVDFLMGPLFSHYW